MVMLVENWLNWLLKVDGKMTMTGGQNIKVYGCLK